MITRIPTAIPGVIVIEPTVHRDSRGFFLETYHADKYRECGITGPFVQDNFSKSIQGTLRGMHLQTDEPQGKLVRVVEGEILDVAVDVRRGSPTFGHWVSVALSGDNFRQCYVPPGFAHGFYVVSDTAEVEYKCTRLYNPSSEIGIIWNDPEVAIDWPTRDPVLSAKDARLPRLADILSRLPRFEDCLRSPGPPNAPALADRR